MSQAVTWHKVEEGVSWTGGRPTWRAQGYMLMWGPRIVRVCVTKRGARFAAWRRRRGLVL